MLWKCRDRTVELDGETLVMGVLNVTPDSFWDGGSFLDPEKAVRRGIEMIEEGAAILDVGGESTRPGAGAVDADEEIERIGPVIMELAKREDVLVSVDTTKAKVARSAIEAGAHIINDVSALSADKEMGSVARESGAGVVLMHMQGNPRTMQDNPHYGNVVSEVSEYLLSRIAEAVSRGLETEQLAIDPGIGFGKTLEHNIRLLNGLQAFHESGRPLVVGLSRKSFLGKITGRPVEDRLVPSVAAMSYCVVKGAHVVRTHDVRDSVDAVKVVKSLSMCKWN